MKRVVFLALIAIASLAFAGRYDYEINYNVISRSSRIGAEYVATVGKGDVTKREDDEDDSVYISAKENQLAGVIYFLKVAEKSNFLRVSVEYNLYSQKGYLRLFVKDQRETGERPIGATFNLPANKEKFSFTLGAKNYISTEGLVETHIVVEQGAADVHEIVVEGLKVKPEIRVVERYIYEKPPSYSRVYYYRYYTGPVYVYTPIEVAEIVKPVFVVYRDWWYDTVEVDIVPLTICWRLSRWTRIYWRPVVIREYIYRYYTYPRYYKVIYYYNSRYYDDPPADFYDPPASVRRVIRVNSRAKARSRAVFSGSYRSTIAKRRNSPPVDSRRQRSSVRVRTPAKNYHVVPAKTEVRFYSSTAQKIKTRVAALRSRISQRNNHPSSYRQANRNRARSFSSSTSVGRIRSNSPRSRLKSVISRSKRASRPRVISRPRPPVSRSRPVISRPAPAPAPKIRSNDEEKEKTRRQSLRARLRRR